MDQIFSCKKFETNGKVLKTYPAPVAKKRIVTLATKKAFYRPVSGDVQDKNKRTKGGNISTIGILITVYIGGRVAQLRRGRTDQSKDNPYYTGSGRGNHKKSAKNNPTTQTEWLLIHSTTNWKRHILMFWNSMNIRNEAKIIS